VTASAGGSVQEAAEAFDSLAGSYQAAVESRPVTKELHRRIHHALAAALPPSGTVLDFGAGTGADSLWLAASGRTVVAVDLSAQMLEQLRVRARAQGLSGAITSRVGSTEVLARLAAEGSIFVGAVSSLGALNTLASPRPFFAAVAPLLPPGSPLIVSTINPWCLSELTLGIATGSWSRATRRLRGPQQVPVGRGVVTTHLHSLAQLRAAAEIEFELLAVEALPLVLPAPQPSAALQDRGGGALLELLMPLDRSLARRRLLSALGDHLLLQWRRRGSPSS